MISRYALYIATFILLSINSQASCISPDGDSNLEDDFTISKIEVAYRTCGIQSSKIKVNENGCVLYLKPKGKLLKDPLLVFEKAYPVAASGTFCKKKNGDTLKLKIKTTVAKCCGVSEWVSLDINKCKDLQIPAGQRHCHWQNVRWELSPKE